MKIKIKNKNTIFSLSFLNKAVYLSLIIFGLVYIFSVNNMSTKGYILQDLKGKLNELNIKNDENELRIMTMESLPNISARAKSLKMVKAGRIEYATGDTVAVAKK